MTAAGNSSEKAFQLLSKQSGLSKKQFEALAKEASRVPPALDDFAGAAGRAGRDAQGLSVGTIAAGTALGNLAAAGATKAVEAVGAAFGVVRDQIGASINEFAELDQSLTTFRALTGLGDASADFRAVEEEVKRLGATTTFTSGQVGELAVSLSRGGLSAQQVNQSLDAVSKAALASSTDLAQTGEIITQVGNTFGGLDDGAEGFTRIADILVTAANNSATTVSELGEAFKAVGPLAAQAGLDAEETARFFALFASAGVTGAEAGTALRGTLNRLVPAIEGLKGNVENLSPSAKNLAGILGSVGLSAEDFTDAAGELDGNKILGSLTDAISRLESPTEKLRSQSPASVTNLALKPLVC
ncbi:MAG: phage tail tape measure protein [Spirulinaceae cyanobacterium SM2_1_0]|nr:phage tail tape measure protein [Spirulinaceae cyanobacterium SM2_1_0]